MSWARSKATKVKRFFEDLDPARVESIAKYFNKRAGLRKKHDWRSECFDVSDQSAFPRAGLTGHEQIDRSIYQSTARLLPSVYFYFDFKSPLDLGRFVNSVVSCSASTRNLSNEPRSGNTRNQILRAIDQLKTQYRRINNIFISYPEIKSAFDDVTDLLFASPILRSFDTLRALPSVEVLVEIIFRHIELDIGLEGDAGRFISFEPRSAKPKLNCVDRSAFICDRFSGPRVITTPGSDFAFICGIFFEIATGRRNESMQGAIIGLLRGDRPELYWYEELKQQDQENSITREMDLWTINYEARRALVMAKVAAQFRNDLSLYADLFKRTVEQIKNAEDWIVDAEKRAKSRSLGEPNEKMADSAKHGHEVVP
jgi:hypothetical protein